MLEARKSRSIAEIAEAEKVDRSFVSRLLDLTLLAADIQEAILEGRQPKGMQLEELMLAASVAQAPETVITRVELERVELERAGLKFPSGDLHPAANEVGASP